LECPTEDIQKLIACKRLAEIAPSLSANAVKLLTSIIRETEPPNWRLKATQTVLSKLSGCSVATNKRTLPEITAAGLLEVNHGRQHQANIFRLTARLTQPAQNEPTQIQPTQIEPPATIQPAQTEPPQTTSRLKPNHLESQPAQNEPPQTIQPAQIEPTYKEERAPAPASPARVENYREVLEKDRSRATALEILRADPSAYAPEDHAHVAQRIASHQAKHGTRVPDQPPDLTITAQILAAAGSKFDRIMDYLRDSAIRPGDVWPWYVSVMAERCAGIGRKAFSQARTEARAKSQRHPAPPATHANPYCGEDGKPDMAAIAKLKRMTS